ncbi:MAG TPA: hypothetical protein VFA75_05375 [Nevskia sp.]|nr:hypothetical protein [Nevskia sp.]
MNDPLRAVDNSLGSLNRMGPVPFHFRAGTGSLHRPAAWDVVDAAFWSIATWFPLAIGLIVQEQPGAPIEAGGMVLTLFLFRMLRACGASTAWPLALIGLRLILGAGVGYAFGGI